MHANEIETNEDKSERFGMRSWKYFNLVSFLFVINLCGSTNAEIIGD